MGPTERFSPADVQRLLGLTRKQLDSWDRLGLVSPQGTSESRFYDFRDLIGLRTVKQLLETGVSANRLQKAVLALNEKLSRVEAPLSQLRILSDGKDILVEQGTGRLEPLSGQFVLNFQTRELQEGVRSVPKRTANDWLAVALSYESDESTRRDAIDAYNHCIAADPANVDALLNCGTLYYEEKAFAEAANYFRRALALEPQNTLGHFNLGSVLEEMGQLEEARQHLRRAVTLEPDHADAHYNLAFVSEKLRSFAEAREHWQTYVKLDPTGPWSAYARQRIAASQIAKSAKR